MRSWMFLGVAATAFGCARGASPLLSSPPPAHVETPVQAANGIDVSSPYAASVMYALDALAGEIRHAAGYAELLGVEGDPEWLERYRVARAALRGQVEDLDGWYTPLTRCSYEHADIESFLACARPASGEHARVIEKAVREVDARLAPKWPLLSQDLAAFGGELARTCTGPVADDLLDQLRDISSLSSGTPLAFKVVLVGKPMGGKNHAHQEAAFLVLEASREMRAPRLSSVVFHEIAHLAFHRSPAAVDGLETALAARGEAGVVAGNLWEEALATAYGNGIAAAKVDPRFRAEDSMYADPAIDAVAHALYARMKSGETFTLSRDLAPRLSQIVEDAWPRARWRLRDVLQRVVLFADEPELARAFSVRVRAIASYTKTPLGDDLDRAPKAPPGTPRLVLASAQSLRARKGVLTALGISPKEIDARLKTAPAIVRWTHDAQGIPLVVVVGRDSATTKSAVDKWSAGEVLPTNEWTPL